MQLPIQPEVKERMQQMEELPASHRVAWLLPKRPASSVREVVVEWRVPLERLRSLDEGAAAGTFRGEGMPAADYKVLHGVEWGLSVGACKAGGGATTAFYVRPQGPPGHQGGAITACSVKMQAGPITETLKPFSCQAGWGWGFADFFKMGKKWDEQAWCAKGGLVGADGKVVLRATISGVCSV